MPMKPLTTRYPPGAPGNTMASSFSTLGLITTPPPYDTNPLPRGWLPIKAPRLTVAQAMERAQVLQCAPTPNGQRAPPPNGHVPLLPTARTPYSRARSPLTGLHLSNPATTISLDSSEKLGTAHPQLGNSLKSRRDAYFRLSPILTAELAPPPARTTIRVW